MMASIGDSGSPQYLVFQPLPDGLSYRQRDKHLKNILVADLRSAFVLIAELDVSNAKSRIDNICLQQTNLVCNFGRQGLSAF